MGMWDVCYHSQFTLNLDYRNDKITINHLIIIKLQIQNMTLRWLLSIKKRHINLFYGDKKKRNLSPNFPFGICKSKSSGNNTFETMFKYGAFLTNIEVSVDILKHFEIYGNQKLYMESSGAFMKPTQAEWNIGLALK